MKKTAIALAIILLSGCTAARHSSAPLVYKSWHTSPDANPMSNVAYPYASWATVRSFRRGMPSFEVVRLVGQPLQWYHHPVNAIVYSTDLAGEPVEVALRLSDDKSIVLDLSFKVMPIATSAPDQ